MWIPYVLLFISILNFGLGWFIFLKNPRARLNQTFCLSATLIGFWVLENYWLQLTASEWMLKLIYAQAPFTILAGFLWVNALVGVDFTRHTRRGLQILTAIGIYFFFVAFISRDFVVGMTSANDYTTGAVFNYYSIYASILLIGLIAFIFTRYRKAPPATKSKVLMIYVGVTFMLIISTIVGFVLPAMGHAEFNALDSASSVVFVLLGAYSIVARQLFDVRVVIRRVLVFSTLLIFIFSLYSVVVFALSSWFHIDLALRSLLAAVLIAFGFEPVKSKLQRLTERYLFVADYQPDEEFKKLTEALAGVVDLNEALRQVMRVVTDGLHLSRAAAIVLMRDDKGSSSVVKQVQNVHFPAADRLAADEYRPVIDYFERQPAICQTLQLQSHLTQEQRVDRLRETVLRGKGHLAAQTELAHQQRVASLLESAQIAVVVPVMVKRQLIGLLFFGDKRSADAFYEEDLKFLSIVGAQTGSAIEKARLYEEDQLKSEFVSIASHELLTPTAAIEGYLSMILEEKMAHVDPKAEEYLWVVYHSAQRLSSLVKDLLSASRLEAGRIVVEPKVFDLDQLVKDQVDQLQIKAGETKLKLTFTKPSQKSVSAYADPDKVTQILINLIGNGLKYTPKGGVSVAINDQGKFWEVAITDTGIGLSEADRAHLFEKFYRVKNDQTAGIMGTGLGLYISQAIITMMGGDITVQSKIGVGSTFAFTVPKLRPRVSK